MDCQLTELSRTDKVQAGNTKARAVPVMVKVWVCSACGRKTLMTDPNRPPRRCSNRKKCGVKFYQ